MPVIQALAVPILGWVGSGVAGFRRISRVRRMIEVLAKTREALPEGSRPQLDGILDEFVAELVRLERRRLTRTVDGAALAAVVFVSVVGGAAFAGGWAIDRWWSVIPGAAIALFCVALMSYGITTVFKYPEDQDDGKGTT